MFEQQKQVAKRRGPGAPGLSRSRLVGQSEMRPWVGGNIERLHPYVVQGLYIGEPDDNSGQELIEVLL